jgi:hypothetical protein
MFSACDAAASAPLMSGPSSPTCRGRRALVLATTDSATRRSAFLGLGSRRVAMDDQDVPRRPSPRGSDTPFDESTQRPARHRWVKLREHTYICRKCGTGRENAQDEYGNWFATFHRPDGRSVRLSHVPPCEPGPRTADYLAKHAEALAVPF